MQERLAFKQSDIPGNRCFEGSLANIQKWLSRSGPDWRFIDGRIERKCGPGVRNYRA